MKKTEVRFDLSGLDDFKREATRYITRVGILGEKASRTGDSGLNNAEIGLIQMFGSITKNIPPRDFLVTPLEDNRDEIVEDMQKSQVRSAIMRRDFKKVYALLGAIAEKVIQIGFETGGYSLWELNAPSTVAKKGSDQPLIDTAQLRRSITSDVVRRNGKTA